MRAVVWEAYILCIKPTDVCAKARCQELMLSGKGHSVALFNVSYSHTDMQSKAAPVALSQTGYCLAWRCIILSPPPPKPLTHSQADAMEFSGHHGSALPSQGSYQSCWEGSRPV